MKLELTVPAELVEQIAARAAELMLERHEPDPRSRWMTVAEAAEHARCDVQRIYDLRSDGRLTRHKAAAGRSSTATSLTPT